MFVNMKKIIYQKGDTFVKQNINKNNVNVFKETKKTDHVLVYYNVTSTKINNKSLQDQRCHYPQQQTVIIKNGFKPNNVF